MKISGVSGTVKLNKSKGLVASLLFSLMLGYSSVAFSEDEYIWTVEKYDPTTLMVSTPGITMHGDKLRIRIVKDGCDYGQLWTSVYTMPAEGVDESTFVGKKVAVEFMGQKLSLPVIHAGKFILGYLVMLDMGVYDLNRLTGILSSTDELSINYLNSSQFKAKEYFDIPFNSWSTNGIQQAVKSASQQCKKLESKFG